MIPVQVDPGDPMALHEQVAGEVRRAIADGEVHPGERLPRPGPGVGARVNHNTVLRALASSETKGSWSFAGAGVSPWSVPPPSAVP